MFSPLSSSWIQIFKSNIVYYSREYPTFHRVREYLSNISLAQAVSDTQVREVAYRQDNKEHRIEFV